LVDAILTPTREPSLLSSQIQQGPGHPLESGSLTGEASLDIFTTVAWIVYLLRSRRVKATFVH
jgi:hypothetical protein